VALLELLVPFVAAGGWLWWIRRADRYDREPWGLVLCTFGLGAAAGLAGLTALVVCLMLLPEEASLVPVFLALVPLHVLAMTAVIYLYPYRRPQWDEPFDGLVYGGAAGIGYGLVYSLWWLVDGLDLGFRSAVFSMPVFMLSGLIIGHYLSQVRFGPRHRAWAMWAKGLITAGLYLAGIELAQAAGGAVMGRDNPLASVVVYATNTVGWLIAMWAMDAGKKASPYDPANYKFQLAPTGCPACGTGYPVGARFCNQCGHPVAGPWEVQR
jgi:RsiW-degrading membrane proteinase PrsW (M82 family)